MRKLDFSIRTTLLVLIGLLNVLITAQVGYNTYKSWINHREARILKHAAGVSNLFFTSEKFLSLERGASMAAVYASSADISKIMDDIRIDQQNSDHALFEALGNLDPGDPLLAEDVQRVKKDHQELAVLRQRLDNVLRDQSEAGNEKLAEQIFSVTTELINDIHVLIKSYSRPFLIINPSIARQMRFSHVIWNITEHAGREYAMLGKVIAENKYPTHAEQQNILIWRGRAQYAWELAHDVVQSSSWSKNVEPFLNEAETHYFMTFDQIKDIFSPSLGNNDGQLKPSYPISVAMWLEMAAQAVESLHAMNDAVLEANTLYVNSLMAEAERSIIVNLSLLVCALILSFLSMRVIITRVIRPVNAMVDALYKATQGETYHLPKTGHDHDEIGKLSSVLNIFRENALQLREERDKAQAANIAKSEFLANMSHEIRTPMNVVLGLANILSRSQPLNAKQAEFVKTLQLSAESLLTLINDLLDFSKIETRALELEKIPFSLARVTSEVITIMSLKAREKNLPFITDFSAIEGMEFIGDPTRIKQILMNICGNAIKFTENGSVRMKITSNDSAVAGQANVFISVTDTGIGIPSDKLDFIFEKFTQADTSITRKYGGTGLGLAITKALVERMHGQIMVESMQGQGTTFTIFLPLPLASPGSSEHDAPEKPQPNQMAKSVPLSRKLVLLVEDYKPNVLVASVFLEQFGFEYEVAESGYQAIAMAREKPYGIILMDVQMHGMDGFHATEAIRAMEKSLGRPRSRIIGMTAHALPSDRKKCLAAGMDDYLSKPFNPEDLRKKLSVYPE